MSHFIYPSDFIYWTKSKNHESNKKELIQKNGLLIMSKN